VAPVLEGINLFKIYEMGETQVSALNGVFLEVNVGEFVSIMGPSGCGKSTLLQILGCLDRPTNGEVRIDSTTTAKLNDSELAKIRGKKIGFIFQSFNLLPTETAMDNVELPLQYSGVSAKERQRKAQKALEAVGLGDRGEHKPSELSGGQRQRVAIARALANDPSIILADEPTGALDSKSGIEVIAIMQRLNDEGRTIVMVTHDPGIAQHSKRIVRILDGKITSDEPVKNQLRAGQGQEAYGQLGAAIAPATPSPQPPPRQDSPPAIAPVYNQFAVPVQAPIAQPVPMAMCPRCGADNRVGAKFCRTCGFHMDLSSHESQIIKLRLGGQDVRCRRCGNVNRGISKFCGRCGEPIIAQVPL
jgi:putative ABC transport system ATP-binding protein